MLHSSLNPIKSPRGSNGCFSVFCAGWPALGCGVACSEVKLSVQTHSSSESDSGRSTFCSFYQPRWSRQCSARLCWVRTAPPYECTVPSITFASHYLMDGAVTPLEISLHTLCQLLLISTFLTQQQHHTDLIITDLYQLVIAYDSISSDMLNQSNPSYFCLLLQ